MKFKYWIPLNEQRYTTGYFLDTFELYQHSRTNRPCLIAEFLECPKIDVYWSHLKRGVSSQTRQGDDDNNFVWAYDHRKWISLPKF